ncbi:CheR family methyltransferase [Rhizomicrobium electricum]|jgi:chemotaxis protein methyltransferase CheR|uniref:Chemotaxis protein methyltransferase n=1 Tax=Rhizomicrobium electricum TaxID=480070 RepID=A0ABP3PFG1_9PROT|nr:CheR family methyltransferase [Rhizomicrobium electricum]NIJ48060.1 chemotaxis protein methyltransferase CheR [Rhizomicrobium electricum]
MIRHVAGPLDDNEPLSPFNFERLTKFIKNYSGIALNVSRRTMLEGRLRRRCRAVGIDDVNEYCRILFDETGPEIDAEIVHLMDAVTTNKTDFFREPAHFDYLTQTILPDILRSGPRRIKAWSAACSIGAEPYTLAMLLDDFCRKHPGMDYSILATDLSYQALQKALIGRFPEAMVDPVPDDFRHRYVMRSSDGDEVRMSPQLRSAISFARLNLMDETYPVPADFDLIFLRNVLIYFDKPTQLAVPTRLCRHLRLGGHLVLGHSESVSRSGLPLAAVANTIFQRQ